MRRTCSPWWPSTPRRSLHSPPGRPSSVATPARLGVRAAPPTPADLFSLEHGSSSLSAESANRLADPPACPRPPGVPWHPEQVPGAPHRRVASAAVLLTLVLLASLLGATSAAAGVLEPKGKRVYFGVSDTGDPAGFGEFSTAVAKHPAVIESFRPWGSDVRDSIQRWEIARARPMIHITTADPQTGTEVLSLAAIASGAGDSYLIRLNPLFAEKKMRAYVRPLGEPNRCLNVYAAYECAGKPREAADSARNYRRAFRRIYVIVHGGGKAK